MAYIAKLVFLFGPFLVSLGTLNYILTPLFAKLVSQRILLIEPGTVFYDKWISTPVPFKVDIYVFDVQNPKEVMKGARPVVKEIGPYRFIETREKKILKYSSNRETVTYLERKLFEFERSESIGDLDRHFIIPNVAFLSTISIWNGYLKNVPLNIIVQPIAESFLSTAMEYYQQNLFINVTIDQVLFKGVHLNYVPMLESIAQIFGRFAGIGNEIKALSNSSFCFFKYINATWNGPYEVYTGHLGLSKLAQLKRYKDKSILDLWDTTECNTVKGSDGIQFTPLKDDKSSLYVFTHELCRPLKLEYIRNSEVRGIRTYRYETSSDVFTKKNPNDNKCDCTESYRCKHSGVIDLSPCWFHAPLYGSTPHFFEFPELSESIIGLKPNKSKHKSFLELDPITGSSLRGSKRAQLNAYIERVSTMRSIRAVKDELFIPLFWYDEFGEIDDQLEEEIKMRSVYPLKLTSYFTLFCMIIGTVMSMLSCLFCICCRKHKCKIQSERMGPKDVYLDKNYRKFSDQDDAESTKTESTTSSNYQISMISNNKLNDDDQRSGFILVQPVQFEQRENTQHNSLAIVPYNYQLSKFIDNDHKLNTNSNKSIFTFKSQIESNNYIPAVDYQVPSQMEIDESIKAISQLIELNNQNFKVKNETKNNLQLIPVNHLKQRHHQDHINEQKISHHKSKLNQQFSSQDSSFDYD